MTIPPFEIIPGSPGSPWLVTCDHASNFVPPEVNGGTLGLSDAEMSRHIAFDVGAAGVSRHLARLLDAPAILGTFSRLVIDPNRGEDDPTLMMRLYDHTIIPGNQHATPQDIDFRLNAYYRPYHAALADLLADDKERILIAVHSFTPRLNGRSPRPWHIGILYSDIQSDFALPLIERLRKDDGILVGENEPYAGHLPGDSVDRHALQSGRPNALIELRHDLIDDEAGQLDWAERLASALTDVLNRSGK